MHEKKSFITSGPDQFRLKEQSVDMFLCVLINIWMDFALLNLLFYTRVNVLKFQTLFCFSSQK